MIISVLIISSLCWHYEPSVWKPWNLLFLSVMNSLIFLILETDWNLWRLCIPVVARRESDFWGVSARETFTESSQESQQNICRNGPSAGHWKVKDRFKVSRASVHQTLAITFPPNPLYNGKQINLTCYLLRVKTWLSPFRGDY